MEFWHEIFEQFLVILNLFQGEEKPRSHCMSHSPLRWTEGSVGKLGAWRGYVAVTCCLLQTMLVQSAVCFTFAGCFDIYSCTV